MFFLFLPHISRTHFLFLYSCSSLTSFLTTNFPFLFHHFWLQPLQRSICPFIELWFFPAGAVQFSSIAQWCPTLWITAWITARQASLSITNSRSLLKLMSIESVMPSSHLILCHPLLLPPIPPSSRVFSNESTLQMRWPKYWSFNCGISPSNEHPGLISFRMDWLDLLAVQGTLKCLLQHQSSKA